MIWDIQRECKLMIEDRLCHTDFVFNRNRLQRFTTGSLAFDVLLGGGLPTSCVTDVFGAASTGKTQFSFQNVVTSCQNQNGDSRAKIKVVFVDCTGSFRPERIIEIAENRSINPKKVLEGVSSITVRSSSSQIDVNRKLFEDNTFSSCRLLIVDDVTSNFVSDYSKESEIPARQRALAMYARRLSYIANRRSLSVLLTNSIRSRGDLGEGETTGEVLSSYSLFRLHFSRVDQKRYAKLVQPDLTEQKIRFEISSNGIS